MDKFKFLLITALILSVFLSACKEEYTPKPRAYFRIDFPEKGYIKFKSDCPFTFDYPVYSEVKRDREHPENPCWINIDYPRFQGRIHITYKPVDNNLERYLEDARTLTYKHTSKATDIRETLIVNDTSKVYGILYDIKGDAASQLQFFLTDSVSHFLRASLYFNVPPNQDSLAPVLDFVKKDVNRMIDTFEWK